MFIESYSYVHGTELINNAMLIPELNRDKYMTAEYMKNFPKIFNVSNVRGKTAFLYIGGPASHHSDIRNINHLSKDAKIAIKGQIGYASYTVARKLGNIDYMSINANTCASGIYALHEASRLFNEDFDDVIIYGEEMVDDTLQALFKQLNIELLVGDAVAMMHLTRKKTTNSKAEIPETKWMFNIEASPMTVSAEGYTKLIRSFNYNVDTVKTHGTGTKGNNLAENNAIENVLGEVPIESYKGSIGHTQGVSGLIEVCMLLDKGITGNTLCLASGLGGFYGGCIVKV